VGVLFGVYRSVNLLRPNIYRSVIEVNTIFLIFSRRRLGSCVKRLLKKEKNL